VHNYTHREILNWSAFLTTKAQESRDPRLTNFYSAGTFHEDTKVEDVEFVALDFETTGLDADKNSIISIGLVPFTLQRISCREAKHWFVTPEDKLKEDSIIIHGITHSDLKGAPDLLRILEQLLDELAGKVVVVHYRRIERDFFDAALRSLINEGIVFPIVDTMQLEADLLRNEAHKWKNLFKKKETVSIRLGNSRTRYNLPTYPPHDALTDAIATAELLQAQIQHHFSPETPINKLWL
jgi:DNA polymerase-3 subunit epsilon